MHLEEEVINDQQETLSDYLANWVDGQETVLPGGLTAQSVSV